MKESRKKNQEVPHFSFSSGKTEILIIGTAHVSSKSVEDVEQAFNQFRPDAVCVELCKPRFESMMDKDRWRKLDLARLIKDKKLALLISSLILSSFQKKIGEKTGVKPGAEMLMAADLTRENGKRLIFADREVRVTLMRAWSRIGFFRKMWLASSLLASLLVREDIDSEEIERLKQEDILTDLFKELPAKYQSLKDVIIDERDSYIAEKIRRTCKELEFELPKNRKKKVLAVVGAGHLAGISRIFEKNESVALEALDELPPKRYFKNILSWMIVSVLAILLLYFIRENDSQEIWELIYFWVLCRSIGSGIGAVIARAHPVTILVTVLIAPFSFFIFVSRLWMYSALTELWFKKPQVEDFENIADDTDSMRGFIKSLYRNRVLHLILVIFLVSMGLTVGNLVFWSDFFRQFYYKFF